jgi:hypothetical protein
VLFEHVQQFAHGQLNTFQQGAGHFALLIRRRLKRALHVVVNGQHVAGQLGATVILQRFIINLGHLVGIGLFLGHIDVIKEVFVLRLSHVSPFIAVRQHPPDQLGCVIHNRNDPAIVQPRGPNDPNRSDNLSIRVHIWGNHQRGTRK